MVTNNVTVYQFEVGSTNDESDGAHLTSFGIEFQTEEEAKENELLIVHFLLLLLLSGTLFQMMSGVPHHSHHLSLV